MRQMSEKKKKESKGEYYRFKVKYFIEILCVVLYHHRMENESEGLRKMYEEVCN